MLQVDNLLRSLTHCAIIGWLPANQSITRARGGGGHKLVSMIDRPGIEDEDGGERIRLPICRQRLQTATVHYSCQLLSMPFLRKGRNKVKQKTYVLLFCSHLFFSVTLFVKFDFSFSLCFDYVFFSLLILFMSVVVSYESPRPICLPPWMSMSGHSWHLSKCSVDWSANAVHLHIW